MLSKYGCEHELVAASGFGRFVGDGQPQRVNAERELSDAALVSEVSWRPIWFKFALELLESR